MLQLHPGAGAVRDEANFDFGGGLPGGRLPAEDNRLGRLECGDAADFELGAVAESLVEPPTDAALDKNVLGLFASEKTLPSAATMR